MKYIPNPIDTKNICLDETILLLSEQLARNSHDVWAQERIRQGWVYGPARDDEKKEHPCLIPYEELPETEKVYDRNAALETLRAILSLGYEIKKADR